MNSYNKFVCIGKWCIMALFLLLGGFIIHAYSYSKAKEEYKKEKHLLKEKSYDNGYEDGYIDALVNM